MEIKPYDPKLTHKQMKKENEKSDTTIERYGIDISKDSL